MDSRPIYASENMNLKEEFAVWINPYPGQSGYVVKTFDNEQDAKDFATRHTGIKKHGGRIERTFTTCSVVMMLEPEPIRSHFPHVNRRR